MSKLNLINQERRKFFKYGSLGMVSLLGSFADKGGLLGRLVHAAPPSVPALTPLSEKDPVAVSLGYHVDANRVDVTKWTKRSGPAGKEQTCSTCMFYSALKDDSGKGKVGKCQIFPNHTVSASGWCNTWTKKPA